jgi:hypothetical protein
MLTEFIYQWNPFNLCGKEVEVDDLICNPLTSTETLRQDACGHCRRIKVPSSHSSLWERFVFWLQTSLNHKGHLEAIDRLISLFHEKLLQNPPQFTEKLQEFNSQIDQLRLLKNDYGFVYLKQGNPDFIESRLDDIQQDAYSVFAQHLTKQSLEEENARLRAFILFQENVEQKLEKLALHYQSGLQKARLLLVSSSHVLKSLFEERVNSLQERLNLIQELQQQIDEMEERHNGKFTIPYIKDCLRGLRMNLFNEVRKIGFEAEVIIGYLIINYRIAPCKEDVKFILDSIQINPETSSDATNVTVQLALILHKRKVREGD